MMRSILFLACVCIPAAQSGQQGNVDVRKVYGGDSFGSPLTVWRIVDRETNMICYSVGTGLSASRATPAK
jgi:hypothetical protein